MGLPLSMLPGFVDLMHQTGYRVAGAPDWTIPTSVALLEARYRAGRLDAALVKLHGGVMLHHRIIVEHVRFSGTFLSGSHWWTQVPSTRYRFQVLPRRPWAIRWLGFAESPRFETLLDLPKRGIGRRFSIFCGGGADPRPALAATPGLEHAMARLPYVNLLVANGVVELHDARSAIARSFEPYSYNRSDPALFEVRDLATMVPYVRTADVLVSDLVVRTAHAVWT